MASVGGSTGTAGSGDCLLGRADRVRDGRVREAGDGDDVARVDLVHRHPLQAAEGQQLGEAAGLDHRAIGAQHLDRHVEAGGALLDAAREDAAEEVVVFQDRRVHREGRVGVDRRLRHVADDEVEHRVQVLARAFHRRIGPALAAGGEEHREVELLVRGAEVSEEVEHLVMHLMGARVLAVDLVHDDDRADAAGQRLAEHELGLRQHALGRVDQEDGAIDHREDALHLAAEIGVAGGVDDVQLHAVPLDGGALGEDGDAALALQGIAVHGPFRDLLVLAESAGLLQELIDERGLAVVDVRDDREVTHGHGSGFRAWLWPAREGARAALIGRDGVAAAHT
jgi:hypothetical protein